MGWGSLTKRQRVWFGASIVAVVIVVAVVGLRPGASDDVSSPDPVALLRESINDVEIPPPNDGSGAEFNDRVITVYSGRSVVRAPLDVVISSPPVYVKVVVTCQGPGGATVTADGRRLGWMGCMAPDKDLARERMWVTFGRDLQPATSPVPRFLEIRSARGNPIAARVSVSLERTRP